MLDGKYTKEPLIINKPRGQEMHRSPFLFLLLFVGKVWPNGLFAKLRHLMICLFRIGNVSPIKLACIFLVSPGTVCGKI